MGHGGLPEALRPGSHGNVASGSGCRQRNTGCSGPGGHRLHHRGPSPGEGASPARPPRALSNPWGPFRGPLRLQWSSFSRCRFRVPSRGRRKVGRGHGGPRAPHLHRHRRRNIRPPSPFRRDGPGCGPGPSTNGPAGDSGELLHLPFQEPAGTRGGAGGTLVLELFPRSGALEVRLRLHDEPLRGYASEVEEWAQGRIGVAGIPAPPDLRVGGSAPPWGSLGGPRPVRTLGRHRHRRRSGFGAVGDGAASSSPLYLLWLVLRRSGPNRTHSGPPICRPGSGTHGPQARRVGRGLPEAAGHRLFQ